MLNNLIYNKKGIVQEPTGTQTSSSLEVNEAGCKGGVLVHSCGLCKRAPGELLWLELVFYHNAITTEAT